MKTIDINCDLGEGSGNDSAIMPYISSCSIACGGHAGSKKTILNSLALAQDEDVKTGAHPAYQDIENFGRISLNIPLSQLKDSLRKQLDLFYTLCSNVNHVKPHGALYNDMFKDTEKAEAFIETLTEYDPFAKVYCSPNSALSRAVEKVGMTVVLEGFGDRAYDSCGHLLDRSLPGAVLTHKDDIATNVLNIVMNQFVVTRSSTHLPLVVQTLCMHGDEKNVVENLKHLNNVLENHQVHVSSL